MVISFTKLNMECVSTTSEIHHRVPVRRLNPVNTGMRQNLETKTEWNAEKSHVFVGCI